MSRKFWLWVALGVIALVAAVGLAVMFWPQTFALDDKYYGRSGFDDIDIGEMEQLINEEGSFVVFIYQPACSTSDEFEAVLEDFSEQNQVAIQKTAFVEAKKSGLVGELKYYPSFAIYREGRLVDYLDADDDNDLPYYKTVEGFTEWWRRYITTE